ncbi:MFS transporter [Citricoccus sp.]|uniref:MFS transporter n=1 Tax=Citricoccus sp. TaxID=1978372 RepID=UPI002620D895|nr:MFS transporter [Citricoccus sp.]HRO28837.1 MFS transporter [Citricoccus sp.]HRO92319.1 MFS transporter [Citricoccus sp.]
MTETRPVPRVTGFLTALLAFSAVNAPTVLYAAWREQMGFPATVQTLVYAVYVAGLIPGLILAGRGLRRWPPRTLMTWAVAVSVPASLALALAAGPGALIAGRAVQGLALGVIMTASSAALYQAAPPRPRPFTALLVTLSAILGACLGPLAAGLLADATGGTAAPMAAVLVLLRVHGATPVASPGPGAEDPGRSATAADRAPVTDGVAESAIDPSARTGTPTAGGVAAGRVPAEPGNADPQPRSHLMISLTAATSWSMIGLYQSVGPGLIGAALQVDSLTALGGIVAIVLGVAGLVQVLSRDIAYPAARRLGHVFVILGIAGFAAMLVTGQVWLALVASVGAGVGHGFTYLSATQEMGELVRHHPARAGSLMSRYFAIAYLCMGGFSVGLGIVGDLWALVPAALILLTALASGCAVMLFSRNR